MDADLRAALLNTCTCERSVVEKDNPRRLITVRWWTNPLCPDHGHLTNDAWAGIPDDTH